MELSPIIPVFDSIGMLAPTTKVSTRRPQVGVTTAGFARSPVNLEPSLQLLNAPVNHPKTRSGPPIVGLESYPGSRRALFVSPIASSRGFIASSEQRGDLSLSSLWRCRSPNTSAVASWRSGKRSGRGCRRTERQQQCRLSAPTRASHTWTDWVCSIAHAPIGGQG
jgi:hypothetical protein